MGSYAVYDEILERLYKQLSGKITEDDILVPEAAIKGSGYIWCLKPSPVQVVRIPRGIKCYIVDDQKDALERIKVYTTLGHIILISEEELIYTGFD